MKERLTSLLEQARRELGDASDPERVEALRVKYLGKKGEISLVLGGMGKLAPEERRSLGEVANKVRGELEALITEATQKAADAKLESELRGTKIDVTLPGRARKPGHRHPVSRTMDDVIHVFARLGFE